MMAQTEAKRSPLTTLCYLEKDGQYLMLHRISKKNDVNKGKWIGVGGHFEEGESPEECMLREVFEETGYTADGFTGTMKECDEGKLKWIPKDEIWNLRLWEGDKIFLKLLNEDVPFFSLKLSYKGDELVETVLDGRPLESQSY